MGRIMKALRPQRTRRLLLVGARKGLADSGFFGHPVRNETAFILYRGMGRAGGDIDQRDVDDDAAARLICLLS